MLEEDDYSVRRAAAALLKKMEWKPSNQSEKIAYLVALSKLNELTAIGSPAVDALIENLKNPDVGMRHYTIKTLGNIGDTKAVEALVGELKKKDDEWRNRSHVIKALEKIGKPAVKQLIGLLDNNIEDKKACIAVMELLEKIGDKNTIIYPLISTLRNKDIDVRTAAVKIIDRLRDPRAMDALIDLALNDEDINVSYYAINSLYNIDQDLLMEKLKSKYKSDLIA